MFWVFGYGSLMWDRWEIGYNGCRHDRATLKGFHRSFNKSSTRNWGTAEHPAPTLGLERDLNTLCIGTAFEFEDRLQDEITSALARREASDFTLQSLGVVLPSGNSIDALTPVNKTSANSYIGRIPLRDRGSMVMAATGSKGSCFSYLEHLRLKLSELEIVDPFVDELWSLVCKFKHNREERA